MKRIPAVLGAFLLVVALASIQSTPVAFAHAEPEECTPAIDSTVDTVPTQVVCTTGQSMDPAQSTLSVFNASGVQVDLHDSQVDLNDPDRRTISVSLDTSKITDGVYTVKYVTFSTDDNEEAEGEFSFTVNLAGEGEMHEEGETHQEGEAHQDGGTHSEDHSIATATIDGKEISLQIVSPAKDAAVPEGNVVLTGRVEGVTLGENDTYLNFKVGENEPVKGVGAQTSYTAQLEPGNHDLEISLTMGGTPDMLKAHVHVTVQATEAAHSEGGTHSEDHSMASATVNGKEISLQITSPAMRATVPAGDVTIEAHVEGVTPGENDTYLTFQVDDETPVQAESGATSHTVSLEPGNHDLNVSLTVDGEPDVLKAHVHITVEGAATTLPASTTTLPGTGIEVDYGSSALIAVAGLTVLSAGVYILSRTRH